MDKDAHDFVTSLDVSLDLPVATVGSRGLAQSLDFLILFTVEIGMMVALVVLAAALQFLGDWVTSAAVTIGIVLSFLVQWGYFLGFETAWDGQTPGKRIIGLRVVDETGGRATFTQLAIRNLLRIADFFPMFYGVGILVMVTGGRGRRVGDLAAGTVVVSIAPKVMGDRTWPRGFQGKDVELVERWFQQRPSLLLDRRRGLAKDLVDWLRKVHPDVLPRDYAEVDPEVLLDQVFPLAPPEPSSREDR